MNKKPIDFTLYSMEATYMQDSDTCKNADIDNTIKITMEDSGAGPYYVIETERFAIDNPKELTDLLNDFIKRTK